MTLKICLNNINKLNILNTALYEAQYTFLQTRTCRNFTFLYEDFMQRYVFRFNFAFCAVMLCLYC